MIIIGLTGSIAMGKSTTAKYLMQMGIPVFDADQCVHEMLRAGGKKVKIVAKHFPNTYLEKKGSIDRKILGEIIFADNSKRKLLEKIVHPEVNKQRASWLKWAKRRRLKAVCYDIPLLFETNGNKKCDLVLVVTAPRLLQKQRVLKRKDMTETKFKNILKRQMPETEKIRLADYIIKTGLGFRFARNQVKAVIKRELHEK